MAESKFYINCPFKDKDECKILGAMWDPDIRKWYVPFGLDRSKFKKWWSNTELKLRVIK